MNKTDILIIRACKSGSVEFRLKRLYEHTYYGEYNAAHMARILVKIVETHELKSLDKILFEYLHPDKLWMFGASREDSFDEVVCKACISIIRLSPVSCLEGFIIPRKFR